jgi:hypothetical protein
MKHEKYATAAKNIHDPLPIILFFITFAARNKKKG